MPERVVNIDRLEQISGLAVRFDDDAIAAAIGAVESARRALLANAIPRLVLEVMALDMPVPGEAPVAARTR